MLSKIHINSHNIRSNIKGSNLPVITVKTSKLNIYGNKVEILDNMNNVIATVIYNPEKPLSCGAKVWIETQQPILVDGNLIY